MKKAKFKRWVPLYLMMAPGLIYLFINNYMPMAGLVVAFKNYNVVDGIFGSPWADVYKRQGYVRRPAAETLHCQSTGSSAGGTSDG